MKLGAPTLDQLRIFLAVVDEGSFNAAARKLGRAISVVSYGIANLETQLGLKLLEREGSKRPELTQAGEALLVEARAVASETDALMAKARSLHQGLEPELSLVLDVMMPSDVIAGVLREFQRLYPSVTLRLHVEALGAVVAMLLDGTAGLGVGGPVISDHPDLETQALGAVELVPVAAPSHQLAQRAGIAPGESRKHLQLVLTDRSTLTQGREFSVLSPRSWRLADLGAKHKLLIEGIGWGNMPRAMIADDLAAGRLIELKLPETRPLDYPLKALWRRDILPGPATCWAIEAFEKQLAKCKNGTD